MFLRDCVILSRNSCNKYSWESCVTYVHEIQNNSRTIWLLLSRMRWMKMRSITLKMLREEDVLQLKLKRMKWSHCEDYFMVHFVPKKESWQMCCIRSLRELSDLAVSMWSPFYGVFCPRFEQMTSTKRWGGWRMKADRSVQLAKIGMVRGVNWIESRPTPGCWTFDNYDYDEDERILCLFNHHGLGQ